METKNLSTVLESENGVQSPSINSLNKLPMTESIFKLNIDFNGVSETNEAVTRDNQPALELITKLASNGYYFLIEPKNNRSTGEAYFWITATKQGEDREVFSLRVNNEILNVIVTILRGKTIDISEIDANNLEDFNKQIINFEYVMFINEKAQGRTMRKTYTTNGQMFSSPYKRGMIIYKPYLNPELKAYLNA